MSEFLYVLIMRLTVIHLVILTIASYFVIRVGKMTYGGDKHFDLFLILLPLLLYSPVSQGCGEAIVLITGILTDIVYTTTTDISSSDKTKSICRILTVTFPVTATIILCTRISPEMISLSHPLGHMIAQIVLSFGVFVAIGVRIKRNYYIDIL